MKAGGVGRYALAFALGLLFAANGGCVSYHQGPIGGEPKTAQFAEIDGVRVRYVDVGEGSPVVLVHGFASSLDTWGGVLPELSKKHRVVALDMKGFGWSDRPDGDYSPRAQAELVMKLAVKRGLDKFTLVGHSFGASVVLAATLAYPEKIARIALYDAFVYEDQIPTFFHWSKADGLGEGLFTLFYKERADERIRLAFYDPAFVTEPLVESVEEQLDRPGTVAAALATVRAMRYADVERQYKKVQVPALLLWGREDTVTPLAYGERLASELKQSRLVVYPRCGHFPMREAMASSNRELVAFADEVPAPERQLQPEPAKP